MPKKLYLGDGVYVEVSIEGLTLTTENGIQTTNTIFLEPEVIDNLVRFIQAIEENIGTFQEDN